MLGKMLGKLPDGHLAIYAKFASPLPMFQVVTIPEPRERADRCACNNIALKHGCRSPILRLSQSVLAHPVGLVALQSVEKLPTPAQSWEVLD